jgi:hypothetical protein
MDRPERTRSPRPTLGYALFVWPLAIAIFANAIDPLPAQEPVKDSVAEQVQKLTDAIARTQAQLEQSQRQLNEMKEQLTALQRQLTQQGATPAAPSSASSTSVTASTPAAAKEAPNMDPNMDEIRERQAMQESQIATQEQTKVESESKYPIKLTGLLLFNGFVNTSKVDMPATPTLALPGAGSTGASVQQTILGFDARGPHLFGAASFADLRVDFDGTPQSASAGPSYSGLYSNNGTLLRLRTAHAALQWANTEAFFSLDRPILSPDTPTSLAALAEPALAWSGSLWTWNPQLGVTQDIALGGSSSVRLQAALMDVGDAPWSLQPASSSSLVANPPSAAEQSRWPAFEARVALLGPDRVDDRNHLGVGGYFSPHRLSSGPGFNAWAATFDAGLHLPAHLQFTGSFYRGQALGGLGAGAYKDFAYYIDPNATGYYFQSLDDIGGWAQMKEKISSRFELNAAFGLDEIFAQQLRPFAVAGGMNYQNLAGNRTYTGNAIFSPSAYLQFSFEYRHLESTPVVGSPAGSNIIGIVAGYKF